MSVGKQTAHAGASLEIFLPWRWRWYVPPKRRFTQDLHCATSQKTAFFIGTAVKTSNPTLPIQFTASFLPVRSLIILRFNYIKTLSSPAVLYGCEMWILALQSHIYWGWPTLWSSSQEFLATDPEAGSTSRRQMRSYLNKKVAAPV
jgi:hypothetical protein